MREPTNTKSSISLRCDFCGAGDLDWIYDVPDSRLGVRVAVCARCGLVFSHPSLPVSGERTTRNSSGADWGNIRHGKALRLQPSLRLLDRFVEWSRIKAVLDVGSSRGDFLLWMRETHTETVLVGVEPDVSLVGDYRDTPAIRLIEQRFEEAALPDASFDLVYCLHTLEHADSAAAMLRQMRACLRPGGHLLIEVPNLAVLEEQDGVEEFFIDKHRFHFACEPLMSFAAGLGVTFAGEATDQFNLSLLFQATGRYTAGPFYPGPNDRAALARRRVAEYAGILARNRAALKRVAARLQPFLARQKVVFWGGSKIFDALVRVGGLQVEDLLYVVDEFLCKVLPTSHGVSIQSADRLRIQPPDVVVVLARSSTAEIVEKVRRYGIKRVITFRSLLEAAKQQH